MSRRCLIRTRCRSVMRRCLQSEAFASTVARTMYATSSGMPAWEMIDRRSNGGMRAPGTKSANEFVPSAIPNRTNQVHGAKYASEIGPMLYRLARAMTPKPNAAFQMNKRSEEHTSELQSRENLVCRLLLEKK